MSVQGGLKFLLTQSLSTGRDYVPHKGTGVKLFGPGPCREDPEVTFVVELSRLPKSRFPCVNFNRDV